MSKPKKETKLTVELTPREARQIVFSLSDTIDAINEFKITATNYTAQSTSKFYQDLRDRIDGELMKVEGGSIKTKMNLSWVFDR